MIRRTMGLLAILALAVGLAARGRPERGLANGSDFIFSGTMVLPRASTIDAEETADLGIVRVDEILSDAGGVFAKLVGQQITIRLAHPERAKVGQKMVYFTKGWYYGESIGVIEVGAVPAPTVPGLKTMRDDIERSKQEGADSVLRALLASAELVVSGKVSAIRKSNVPRLRTEHDPDWQEADIEIATVFKGSAGMKHVVILFPGTDDPMWVAAPKFKPGDAGVWILLRSDFAGQKLPHLTAEAPAQFRPLSEEGRIKRLIG